MVLELICENQAGLPVYMQALSSNTNDAKAFSEVTKRHIHCLKAAQNSRYFFVDAALYTEERRKANGIPLFNRYYALYRSRKSETGQA